MSNTQVLKDWAPEGKCGLKFQVCPLLAEILGKIHKLPEPQLCLPGHRESVVSLIPQSGVKIKRQHQFLDSQLSLRKLPVNLGLCLSRVTESLSDFDQSPHLERGLWKGKERAWTSGQTVSWLHDLIQPSWSLPDTVSSSVG